MNDFFEAATQQGHPLYALQQFLDQEEQNETAKNYNELRLAGYALEINFRNVLVVTSDPLKMAVGGIPRGSFLIMTPDKRDAGYIPHFTLLRVLDSADTPLSREMQQTFFELQKKAMPTIDFFTRSELHWSALSTQVLGMYYPHPSIQNRIEFSGDVNGYLSPYKYRIYMPDDKLLDLIINTFVPAEHRFSLGKLRVTECRLPLCGRELPNVDVYVSVQNFIAARSCMIGKTRQGKSNSIKIIVNNLTEFSKTSHSIGQLIFDISGEYANDNSQDDNSSLRTAFPDFCIVYALSPKPKTPSRPLKINFFEHPERSHFILSNLLQEENRNSIYITAFRSVNIPSFKEMKVMQPNEKVRAHRKILIYWAILHKAGYQANENRLKTLIAINPGFSKDIREILYGKDTQSPQIVNLDALLREFELLIEANRQKTLNSTSGKDLLGSEDITLLEFLKPISGAGTKMIQNFMKFHDSSAGDFIKEIIQELDEGKTVILDLGNSDAKVRNYFSEELSSAVFYHQLNKFTNNALGDHYIEIYYEEAQNLFPERENDTKDIYLKLAKEGAKIHIGMVYATQSITAINQELVAQTENFFIAHISSPDEVNALAKANHAFELAKEEVLNSQTAGYIRILTRSQRFVIPVQANYFDASFVSKLENNKNAI